MSKEWHGGTSKSFLAHDLRKSTEHHSNCDTEELPDWWKLERPSPPSSCFKTTLIWSCYNSCMVLIYFIAFSEYILSILITGLIQNPLLCPKSRQLQFHSGTSEWGSNAHHCILLSGLIPQLAKGCNDTCWMTNAPFQEVYTQFQSRELTSLGSYYCPPCYTQKATWCPCPQHVLKHHHGRQFFAHHLA